MLAPAETAVPQEPEAEQQPLLPAQPHAKVRWMLPLDESRRKKLGKRLKDSVERWWTSVEWRKDNASEWRAAAEMLPNDEAGPWDNSSALRAPNTAWAVDQHSARLNQMILAPDPPFTAQAKKPAAIEAAPLIEEVLISHLEEAGWARVARDVHKELSVVGECLVRVLYVKEQARVPEVQLDFDEQAFETLLMGGGDPMRSLTAAVATDDKGAAKVFLGFEERVTKDGIELQIIPFEDMVVLPSTCRDPKEAWGIGERVTLRGLDLLRGAKEGRYYQDEVDELLRSPGDAITEDQELRNEEQGIETGDHEDEAKYWEYLCIELCLYDDLNDDGEDEWYWVTIEEKTGRLLRCQYLPWRHGHPHYVPIRYMSRPRQLHGSSPAERMASLQDAATAAINQFYDLADLLVACTSSGWYDDTAGAEPNKWKLGPARWHKVQNIKGIMPVEMPAGIPAAMAQLLAAIQMLKDWGDLLVGASNPTMGKEAEGDKTLGEVRIVLQQGLQAFEDKAAEVALAWAEVWDQCRWLLAQFGKGGMVEYRKTAAPGEDFGTLSNGMPVRVSFEQIPAIVLTQDVDLIPAGVSGYADRGTRAQVAMMGGQLLDAHWLTGQDPDIAAETLKVRLKTLGFPDWQGLTEKITAAQAKLKMVQQIQGQLALQQGAQQGQAMATEQAGAQQQMRQGEEQARMGQMQGQLGILQQAQDLERGEREMRQPAAKNGAKRK